MSTTLVGKRILIVEDEPLFANNVAYTLNQMGAFALKPVNTAADGLAAVMAGVDAAILDIHLPEGDVYRVASELRRLGKPFLFLSAVDRETVPERFNDAPFVAKPCPEAVWTGVLDGLLKPSARPAWTRTFEECQPTASARSTMIARRLGSLFALRPDETELLHQAGAGSARLWRPKSLIEQPTADYNSPRYLISGWAARVFPLKDGRRQLVQLLLPGDVLTPHMTVRHSQQMVQSLTVAQTVSGEAIRLAARDTAKFPGIAAAVELAAALDRALLLQQVTRLGRQTAYERVANLFLELHYRCMPLGLVTADSFAFPLTQENLADLLGLSMVHVNRTLQFMRRQEMITLKQGRLTLTDIPALQSVAEFKPPMLKHVG